MNDEVAKRQNQHKDVAFEITIEKIEPERLFSFRWHPGAVDPKVDYSKEPRRWWFFRSSRSRMVCC